MVSSAFCTLSKFFSFNKMVGAREWKVMKQKLKGLIEPFIQQYCLLLKMNWMGTFFLFREKDANYFNYLWNGNYHREKKSIQISFDREAYLHCSFLQSFAVWAIWKRVENCKQWGEEKLSAGGRKEKEEERKTHSSLAAWYRSGCPLGNSSSP